MYEMNWKVCLLLLQDHKYSFFLLFMMMTIGVYDQGETNVFFVRGVLFSFFLLLLSIVDWKTGLLPNCVLWPMGLLGVGLQVCLEPVFLYSLFPCAFFAGLFFLLIYWISNHGMGVGDIKFAFVLGCWLPDLHLFLAILLSFWFGGIAAFFLLIGKYKKLQDRLPFGPFMAAGSYLSFVFADKLFLVWMELGL